MPAAEALRPRAAALALVVVALVAIASAWFGARFAPRESVASWLALFAASAGALGATGLWLVRARGASRGVSLGAIVLIGAAALRLGALAAPVSLSDDVHRYAWDGALLAHGHDPYASRPVDVAPLPGLGEDALERLNSPRYYSVYPPLAQAVFALGALVEDATSVPSAFTLRLVFVFADLLAVWALLGACVRLGRSRAWALLYAWHPLAYWEVAAGGHTEALMLPLVLLALTAVLDARALHAGTFLGLAASAKLTALVIAPVVLVFVWRRDGARAAATLAIAAPLVLLAGFAPFASATLWPHLSESLALYSETFSFNAPIYYGARFLLGYRAGWSAPVDPVLMPALGAATLACVGLLAIAQDGSARRLALGAAHGYLAYVLLSRVVHPWYLLAPLALAALAGHRALAVYALVVPLSYLSYALGYEAPIIIAAQLVALAVAWVLERSRPRATHPLDHAEGRDPSAPAPPSHLVDQRGSPLGEASLSSLRE